MKVFFSKVKDDIKSFSLIECLLVIAGVLCVYGALATTPTLSYDFHSAKGDPLQVFLTNFFMRRPLAGIISGFFYMFSPLWVGWVSLVFIVLYALLMGTVVKRCGLGTVSRLIFMMLLVSSPFFFNMSIYQNALPSQPIALFLDAVIVLLFQDSRRCDRYLTCKNMSISLLIGAVASTYQAHVGLVLTACLGVCLMAPNTNWKGFIHDMVLLTEVIVGGIIVWAILAYGPIVLVSSIGVKIPSSGGAHDSIYWVTGTTTFLESMIGFIVGIFVNVFYNSLFVHGLRYVVLSIVVMCILSLVHLVRGKLIEALYLIVFTFSIFALSILQCATANLRTYFCYIPFLAFTGVYISSLGMRYKSISKYVVHIFLALVAIDMGQETGWLYYQRWRVKKLDSMHMERIAMDLWKKYGLNIEKPVAIIGGIRDYPAGWHDLRPFAKVPFCGAKYMAWLPFTFYANVTSHNAIREFYMVAREHVGLVVNLPEFEVHESLRANNDIAALYPQYPQNGYIFEKDGIIIVNLGNSPNGFKRFDYSEYRSPNETLLFRTFHLDSVTEFFVKNFFEPLDKLVEKYPWSVQR